MGQVNKLSRNNTSVWSEDGDTFVRLHRTVVVTFSPSFVRLNTGGWYTVTTKTRMNQASNQFGLAYHVYQKGYDWFVTLPSGEVIPFKDGVEFDRVTGKLIHRTGKRIDRG